MLMRSKLTRWWKSNVVASISIVTGRFCGSWAFVNLSSSVKYATAPSSASPGLPPYLASSGSLAKLQIPTLGRCLSRAMSSDMACL